LPPQRCSPEKRSRDALASNPMAMRLCVDRRGTANRRQIPSAADRGGGRGGALAGGSQAGDYDLRLFQFNLRAMLCCKSSAGAATGRNRCNY
jgi:hypothetical protein